VIASDQGNDRLAGTLEVPAAASLAALPTSAESPFERMLSFGNLFVFLLGALATLALRHASRLSGMAIRGATALAAALDKSRGSEFDRLFLEAMIGHHQGAITMVNQLFGSQGGGEEEIVYRFASDVYADQTTEIDRMNRMLEAFHRSPQ